MARSDFNPAKNATMGNNHDRNKEFNNACRDAGVDKHAFSNWLHKQKIDWFDGDYSYQELYALALEFKKKN